MGILLKEGAGQVHFKGGEHQEREGVLLDAILLSVALLSHQPKGIVKTILWVFQVKHNILGASLRQYQQM